MDDKKKSFWIENIYKASDSVRRKNRNLTETKENIAPL